MTKAVVDDFEPVQIEIQNREALPDVSPLELLEAAAEDLQEVRAVSQTGQRIAKAGGAEALIRRHPISHIGQRPRDARPAAVAAGHTPAQEPPVGSGLVTRAMLVLEMRGFSRGVRVDRSFQLRD